MMTERRWLLVFLALFLGLMFLERPGSWLIDPDEPRYAEIPREMLATGDFLTPRLNGVHYFEKPPLLYWVNAGFIRLGGHNPFAARLAVRLAAVGSAFALLAGLGAAGSLTGLYAAVIFLSAPLAFGLSRVNLTDGLLTFAMTLSLVSVLWFLRRREANQGTAGPAILLGVSVAAAVMTKGLIGIVFPGLVFLVWVALVGEWRRVRDLVLSWATPVFFGLAAPWFILMEKANPGFSRFFFIHEHFQRYATSEAHRPGPVYFFVGLFLVGFLPWTLFLGPALKRFSRFDRNIFREHREELFYLLWLAVILLFFSFSHSKLIPYILPVFPAAAALVALALPRLPDNSRKPFLINAIFWTVVLPAGVAFGVKAGALALYHATGLALAAAAALVAGSWLAYAFSRRGLLPAIVAQLAGLAAFYLVLILALPPVAHETSLHDLAVVARAQDAQVASFESYAQSFPWDLERTIPVVDYQGELASDGVKDPRIFWTLDTFWQHWKSQERWVAILRKDDLSQFKTEGLKQPSVIADNQKYILLANFSPDFHEHKG